MKLAVLALVLYFSFFTSAGNVIFLPDGSATIGLYHFMRIQWDTYSSAFLAGTSMDIQLTTPAGGSVQVATGVPIVEKVSSFDWVVYGIVPEADATIVITIDGSTLPPSETFEIVYPEDVDCKEEDAVCADNIECCSGDCTSGVCGDSVKCYHDGALCSSQFPCCSGKCNEGRVCGDTIDCVIIDGTCNRDADCCSGFCNTSTNECERS